MNIAEIFDIDPKNYDLSRPKYPDELYRDIFEICNLSADSKILEIGIGTGQATFPFLELGAKVTAVELGKNLANFTSRKYRKYDNLRMINGDFMTCDFQSEQFDFIFSATAFHWLPTPQKYEKISNLLSENGHLALFWNRPFVRNENDKSNVACASVYDKYLPSGRKYKPFNYEDSSMIIDELRDNHFEIIQSKIYKRIRSLTTNEYIFLLNTYSDHLTLPDKTKIDFENDMVMALNDVGGKINIYDNIDFYIAKNHSL